MTLIAAVFANGFQLARYSITALILLGAVALGSVWLAKPLSGEEPKTMDNKAPEPAGIARWINSEGLTIAGQKGKVVVLHFWTSGCINCRHNLPYYNNWRKDFPRDKVEIIGVHTPETAAEADLANVVAQVKKLGISGCAQTSWRC